MARRQRRQGIPTELTVAQFEEFVLHHLTVGKRGPVSTGYILKFLYFGGQLKKVKITLVRVSTNT